MPNAPKIEYYKPEATYTLESDSVSMPDSSDYKSKELFYYDLFYQLIRSTGHESRLNRKSSTEQKPFFSSEELISDMGAHYLCYHAGMHKVPLYDALHIIHGFMIRFEEDSRMVVSAATHAQKAVDYILRQKDDSENDIPSEDGQEVVE
jgi:antirestriction protein ArdC